MVEFRLTSLLYIGHFVTLRYYNVVGMRIILLSSYIWMGRNFGIALLDRHFEILAKTLFAEHCFALVFEDLMSIAVIAYLFVFIFSLQRFENLCNYTYWPAWMQPV